MIHTQNMTNRDKIMTAHDTRLHTQQEGETCITVHDDGALRLLEFGDDGIQSIIDRHRPRDLVSPVSQAMLAALLFTPAPEHFLLLGMGGGAIARYLSHRHPHCQGDAVELSPAIAAIAQQFFEFPEHNWQIHQADVRDFISAKNASKLYDYIVLDIAERQHTPHWLTEIAFLYHCRERLSLHGVLCINLAPGDANEFMRQLSNIRLAFDTRTLCLSVPGHRNVLIFAFAQRPDFGDIGQLRQRADALFQHWELPFNDCLDRMIRENPIDSGVF